MYNELRSSILSKDHEKVRYVYERAHALNYSKDSKNITSISLFVEAISLVYLSFIDETDIQYKECIDHIDYAFGLNILAEDKEVNRFLCLRLRCYEELFQYGFVHKEDVAKDRQALLDKAINTSLVCESNEVDIVNMLNMFTTSSMIDLLHNANEDAMYSFLVSQEIIAYKALKAIYIKNNNVKQIRRIEQCLNAISTNLVNRVNGLEKLCENEKRCLDGLSTLNISPSWDVISLGLELPEV